MAYYGYIPRSYPPYSRTQAAIRDIGTTIGGLANQSSQQKALEQQQQLRLAELASKRDVNLAELGVKRAGILAGQEAEKTRTLADINKVDREQEKEKFNRWLHTPDTGLNIFENSMKWRGVEPDEAHSAMTLIREKAEQNPTLKKLLGSTFTPHSWDNVMQELNQPEDTPSIKDVNDAIVQRALNKLYTQGQDSLSEREREALIVAGKLDRPDTTEALEAKQDKTLEDNIKLYESYKSKFNTTNKELAKLQSTDVISPEFATLFKDYGVSLTPGSQLTEDQREKLIAGVKSAYEHNKARHNHFKNKVGEEKANILNKQYPNGIEGKDLIYDDQTGLYYFFDNIEWIPVEHNNSRSGE